MGEWWSWIQDAFSNRQLATGFWIVVAFFFSITWAKTRSAIGAILGKLLNRYFVLLFGLTILWVSTLCWMLFELGCWKSDQVPATVLWTLMSGFPLVARALNTGDIDQGYFKRIFRDCFRLVVVFEFLVVGYSFGLLVELVLVPFFTLIMIFIGFSQVKPEYGSIKARLEWIVIGFVAVVIGLALANIWRDPATFFTVTTGRNFLLPIFLTIWMIPILYVLHCYIHIERGCQRIALKQFQSDDLKRYARRRFFLRFALCPKLLERATKQFQSLPAYTNDDVDQIVEDIIAHERLCKNPPVVDEKDGWSPYIALEYLKSEGFESSYYQRTTGGDRWYAESKTVEIDSELPSSSARYTVEGVEGVATKVSLRASVSDVIDPVVARARFNQISQVLLRQSIDGDIQHVDKAIQSDEDFDKTVRNTRVIRKEERFTGETRIQLSFVLKRDHA